jgi:hypothetical protein
MYTTIYRAQWHLYLVLAECSTIIEYSNYWLLVNIHYVGLTVSHQISTQGH